MSKKGFTLIEMLIVIAIIGILASIVLVGLGPVQRQARDSRRVADLRSVQTLLELDMNKMGTYPAAASWAALETQLRTDGALSANGRLPVDPTNAAPYVYQYAQLGAGTGYAIGTTLETAGTSLMANSATGVSIGTGACGTGLIYCIAN